MNQTIAGLIGWGVFVTVIAWLVSQGNPVFLALFAIFVVAGFIAAKYTKPTEVIDCQKPLELKD